MHGTSLRKYFLIPILLALLIFLGVFVASIYYNKRHEIEMDVERHIKNAQLFFKKQLHSEAELLGALIERMSEQQSMQAAWLAKDRETLLRVSSPFMARLNKMYKMTHFYFHDINGMNFLRVHKPKMYGDVIDRFTMLKAKETGQITNGIEIGPLGTVTFRVVYPWIINDQLMGYIELGEEVDHFIGELKNVLGLDSFVVIHKDFLVRENWELGMQMLGRQGDWDHYHSSVIVNQTLEVIPENISDFLSVEQHEPMEMEPGLEAQLGDKIYRGGFMPLYDARGVEIGEIVVMYDVTANIKSANNTILSSSLLCITIGGLMFTFFWTALGKLELELAEHRYHLEGLVEKRTAEIATINKQLSQEIVERKQTEKDLQLFRNLIDYSNDAVFVINPKTGRFLDVNQKACTSLGYTRKELLSLRVIDIETLISDDHSWDEHIRDVREEGKMLLDSMHKRKDGEIFPVEVSVKYITHDEKDYILAMARDVRKRKQVEEKLKSYQAQLQALAAELSLTEERERRRIAMELHDSVGQKMTIAKIKLGELRELASSSKLAKPLELVYQLTEQSINYTRHLISELSPTELYEFGFEAAAEDLTEQITKPHKILSSFEDDEQPKPLDDGVRVLLFQAVRELLINVVKHAQANHVKVAVCKDNSYIRVSVEDDGGGFDISKSGPRGSKPRGFGLFSIRERLNYHGGRLEIESRPGHGTKVSLVAPLKSHNDNEKSE